MATPLRVLIVEDSADDAKLLLRELKRGGYAVTSERVDTAKDMRAALKKSEWDIVISDHQMPRFDSLAALKLVREQELDLPFIIVSGSIGEDVAVEAMKAGAHDYVMKDKLARLLPAIKRELREAEVRRKRRRAEKALRELAERFRAIFDAATDGILLADAETKQFEIANEPFCEMTGYTQNELAEMGVTDIHPQEDLPHVVEQFEQQIRGERSLAENIPVRRKDGTVFYADVNSSLVTLGGKRYLQGIFRDITERRRAEEALQRAAKEWETTFNSIKDMVSLHDKNYKITETNKSFADALKMKPEEILDRKCYEVVHGRNDPLPDCPHRQALQTKTPARRELFEPHLGIYLEISVSPIFDEEGELVGTVHITTDITKRKEAEEALRVSEERYRGLVEGISNLVQSVAPDGSILFVNRAWRETLGYSEKEIGSLSFLDIIHPESRAHCMEAFRRVLAGEKVEGIETSFVAKDGREVAVEGSASCYFEDGRPVRTYGIFRDVTERRRSEEAIKILARLPREDPSPVLRVSLENEILYANPASAPLLRHWDRRIGDPVPAELGVLLSAARSAGTSRNIDVAASDRLCSFVCAPVAGTGYVNLYGRDITAHRRLEDQLRQGQKMEAVGTLAGGVAHDFNNLLTVILGYANMLRADSKLDEEAHESAEVIEKAANRAAELTRQLLGFARKGKIEETSVDMHRLVKEVASILSRTVDKRIKISRKLRAKPAVVLGDPGQLQQVLLNLAVNSRDAMPEGGEFIFETSVVDLDEAYCHEHAGVSPGRHLLLSVTDTGCGIPEEIQNRIFEPYFTTKKRGEGTGMGLAMAYGIVKNHNGSIRVYSEVGQGTTFKIYLPSARRPAPASVALQAVPRSVGTGRLLLVEDEEVIRAMAKKILEGLGYRVASTADGQEGVEYYEKHHSEIGLVIIDMIMPRMNGRDCFLRLREINPGVKALLSTGYGLNGAVEDLLGEGMLGCVQKPYTAGQLAEAVAKALKI